MDQYDLENEVRAVHLELVRTYLDRYSDRWEAKYRGYVASWNRMDAETRERFQRWINTCAAARMIEDNHYF